MRSKLIVGFLAVVVGFLLVTDLMAAAAAKQTGGKDIKNNGVTSKYDRVAFVMTRCDVEAIRPRRFPRNPEAYVEGWLTCDPAILPETFNNTVCLQVK